MRKYDCSIYGVCLTDQAHLNTSFTCMCCHRYKPTEFKTPSEEIGACLDLLVAVFIRTNIVTWPGCLASACAFSGGFKRYATVMVVVHWNDAPVA